MKRTMDARTVVLGVLAGLLILSPGSVSKSVNVLPVMTSMNTAEGVPPGTYTVRTDSGFNNKKAWKIFDHSSATSVSLAAVATNAQVDVVINASESTVDRYRMIVDSNVPQDEKPTAWALWCGDTRLDLQNNFYWNNTDRYNKKLDSQHTCEKYTLQLFPAGRDLPTFTINQLQVRMDVTPTPTPTAMR